jgi:hypothetical protein
LLRDEGSELWNIIFDTKDTALIADISRRRAGLDGPPRQTVEAWLKSLRTRG